MPNTKSCVQFCAVRGAVGIAKKISSSEFCFEVGVSAKPVGSSSLLQWLMKRLRWLAAVAYCAVTIQVVGFLTTLAHIVENIRRKLGARAPARWQIEKGKVALVTGANRGLGLAVVQLLVSNGVHTLLLCRNRRAAENAVDTLFGKTASRELCTVIEVDLSHFVSVRKAVSEVVLTCMRMNTRLDFVVANAGIMDPPTFQCGADGYELQMQVNTLSHALLIHRLLKAGVVRDSPATRILSVSSFAHSGYAYLFEDPRGNPLITNPSEYHPKLAYAKSKWYQILLMESLTDGIEKQYGQHATCVSVNPGVVDTMMARDYCKGEFPQAVRWLTDPILEVLMTPSLRAPTAAASLIVTALTADSIAVNGQYLSMGPTGRIRRRSYAAYRDRLSFSELVKVIDAT